MFFRMKQLPGMNNLKLIRRFVAGSSRMFGEDAFNSMLAIERRRVERSGQQFVLMLLSFQGQNGSSARILHRAFGVIAARIRGSDLIGWLEEGEILGVIFTLVPPKPCAVSEILCAKIKSALQATLGNEMAKAITVSVEIFPEQSNRSDSTWVLIPSSTPTSSVRSDESEFHLQRTCDETSSIPSLHR